MTEPSAIRGALSGASAAGSTTIVAMSATVTQASTSSAWSSVARCSRSSGSTIAALEVASGSASTAVGRPSGPARGAATAIAPHAVSAVASTPRRSAGRRPGARSGTCVPATNIRRPKPTCARKAVVGSVASITSKPDAPSTTPAAICPTTTGIRPGATRASAGPARPAAIRSASVPNVIRDASASPPPSLHSRPRNPASLRPATPARCLQGCVCLAPDSTRKDLPSPCTPSSPSGASSTASRPVRRSSSTGSRSTRARPSSPPC